MGVASRYSTTDYVIRKMYYALLKHCNAYKRYIDPMSTS